MAGTLYLVATPIGNLKDITYRAVEILRSVDIIACEDTRHTRKLLNHFRISNSVISYHQHNELERADELTDRLVRGESVAIVSDAGTPGISDPGYRITLRAIEIGASVVPIPGPSAFVAAVTASGLTTDSIYFGGFLPSKKGDRRKRLAEVASIPATLVFYESPHRLAKSLADCYEVLGERPAAVVRELTKMYEEIVRSNLSALAARFKAAATKGEIVLVIERGSPATAIPEPHLLLEDRIAAFEEQGFDHKTALKKAAKELGLSKSEAYRQVVQNSSGRKH